MYYVPVAMLKDENEVIKDLQVRLDGVPCSRPVPSNRRHQAGTEPVGA
jgi:hypothetical protein